MNYAHVRSNIPCVWYVFALSPFDLIFLKISVLVFFVRYFDNMYCIFRSVENEIQHCFLITLMGTIRQTA